MTEALIKAGAPDRRRRGSPTARWARRSSPTAPTSRRRAFLPGILSGETGWCIGMSEPDAGSDLASLGTRAVLDGDEYVVNGQKIWTSFGEPRRLLLPDLPHVDRRPQARGHQRDRSCRWTSPGITVNPIQDMTTNRHFCEVFYDDVRVPAANLVGQEGGSFKQTMRQLEHERGGIDRLLSNHALYLDAKAPGRHLRPAGAPGDRPPGDRLPARAAAGAAGDAEAGARRRSRPPPRRSAPSTSSASPTSPPGRVGRRRHAVGAHGARGVCYAPAYTIMGGTSNVLRNIIGERGPRACRRETVAEGHSVRAHVPRTAAPPRHASVRAQSRRSGTASGGGRRGHVDARRRGPTPPPATPAPG